MDDYEYNPYNKELVAMIGTLTEIRRQLTLSAIDYQALGLAKRHEKEQAIELADEVGKVLAILIKSLRKKIEAFSDSTDSDYIP